MEILSSAQYEQAKRLNRYEHRLVDQIGYCPHERAARSSKGRDVIRGIKDRPIPRHRALVIIEGAQ